MRRTLLWPKSTVIIEDFLGKLSFKWDSDRLLTCPGIQRIPQSISSVHYKIENQQNHARQTTIDNVMQQVLEIQNIQILSLLSPRAFIIATALCEWSWSHFKRSFGVRSQKSHVEFRFSFLVSCGMDLFSKCSMALTLRPEPRDESRCRDGNRFWINNWGTRRDYQIFHTFCQPSILFCMITQLDVSSPCPWSPINLSLQTNDRIIYSSQFLLPFSIIRRKSQHVRYSRYKDSMMYDVSNDEFEVCNRWK